jgi:alpha-methylacyl-CoA racemase
VAAGTRLDACLSPVLTPAEAVHDRHNVAIGLFEEHDGIPTPRTVGRFSRDSSTQMHPPAWPGGHSTAVLAEWGLPQDCIEVPMSTGAVVRSAQFVCVSYTNPR